MRLNCVILNYNDSDTTEGLVRLLYPMEVVEEIVVVDNGSTDDSLKQLQALADEKIQVISAQKNSGYGAGNNIGVRYAVEHNQATHVLIANPDILVSEDTLLKLLSMFENHCDRGIVTAVMEDVQYPDLVNAWPLRGFIRELLSTGPISRRVFKRFLEYPRAYFRDKRGAKKAVYVDVVHGSMLMVDGEKFLECGGYDEGIFLYQEEAVLAQRMRTAGYRTVLILNRHYDHEHSASIRKTYKSMLNRQMLREESTLYYMKNYLYINMLQELIAKLWFGVIRLEIIIAGKLGK